MGFGLLLERDFTILSYFKINQGGSLKDFSYYFTMNLSGI